MKKRFFQFATLFLTLTLLTTSLVACKPSTPDPTPAPSENGQPSTTEASPTPTSSEASTESNKIGNLPDDIDLGGEIITILSRNTTQTVDEISVKNEDSDGDPIRNAIFQRNMDVERMLHAEIESIMVEGDDYCVYREIQKTFGPDCPYQIIANPAYTSFENTASGYFHDLSTLGNLDLSASYWSSKFNESASIGNAQYFVTGSISLALRRYIFVTFFNKQLAEKYQLENLYDVVNEKRWTLDYQANIIANMYDDVDGITGPSEGDYYGFLTNSQIFVDPYFAACNAKLLVKGDDNFYKLEPETEKLDAIMQKINNLYYGSPGSYIFIGKADYSDLEKIIDKFTNGEATLITQRLYEVESAKMRGMDMSYGILPIPKFDDDQPEYYSLAHDMFTVFAVLNSVPEGKLDTMGLFLEAMAIESYRTVTPAYYELALKGKYSKDPESWEMLDMIVNNLQIDGGMLYTIKLNDITQMLRTAIRNKQSSFSAIFSKFTQASINAQLKKFQDQIKAIQ